MYKGPDMASVQVVQNQGDPADTSLDTQLKEQDEIKKICQFACITASESYWRISGNDVHGGNQVFKDMLFMKRTVNCVLSRE